MKESLPIAYKVPEFPTAFKLSLFAYVSRLLAGASS